MHEQVEDGGDHGGALEVVAPVGDHAIGGDGDGGAQFVAVNHFRLKQLGRGVGNAACQEQIVKVSKSGSLDGWPKLACSWVLDRA